MNMSELLRTGRVIRVQPTRQVGLYNSAFSLTDRAQRVLVSGALTAGVRLYLSAVRLACEAMLINEGYRLTNTNDHEARFFTWGLLFREGVDGSPMIRELQSLVEKCDLDPEKLDSLVTRLELWFVRVAHYSGQLSTV